MKLDQETQQYIQTVAAKAATAALEDYQRATLSKFADLQPVTLAEQKSSSIDTEFTVLCKTTCELEESIKILAERLAPVLRNNTEKLMQGGRVFNDKDAPLVNALAERANHVSNLNYVVRDLTSRLQIQP
jgi:hypothetical protein